MMLNSEVQGDKTESEAKTQQQVAIQKRQQIGRSFQNDFK